MTIPRELRHILASDPEIISGAVRFKGTRVPVQALLDTIWGGETVDYFIDDFPDVTKSQAMAVLTWEQNKVRKTLGLELVA
jgi:uncharacterized protein (DUF433 family)